VGVPTNGSLILTRGKGLRDDQLKAAVDELLKEINAKK
jgi:hypothetical protein